jgi:hypothetical protein
LIKRRDIAADDVGDRVASGVEAYIKSIGDGPYVRRKTALRRQARGENCQDYEAWKAIARNGSDECRDGNNDRQQDDKRERALAAALYDIVAFFVEPAIEEGDQRAHPDDGVADAPQNRVGIAECSFDRQREQCERQGEGEVHRGERVPHKNPMEIHGTAATSTSPASRAQRKGQIGLMPAAGSTRPIAHAA